MAPTEYRLQDAIDLMMSHVTAVPPEQYPSGTQRWAPRQHVTHFENAHVNGIVIRSDRGQCDMNFVAREVGVRHAACAPSRSAHPRTRSIP